MGSTCIMCPSFTWGTCSIHYLPVLPLSYAPRGASPIGHVLCKAHVSSGLATCVGQPSHSSALEPGSLCARKYCPFTPWLK